MDWILNGIFKTFIGWITSVLDIYFSATLGALGVNLSVFESVFPLVKKLSIGIMAIALGVAFYIFIFQICKNPFVTPFVARELKHANGNGAK